MLWRKKLVEGKLVVTLALLLVLQGLIGWLMVKSGLTDRTSVSHIRLAIHLITAFITFGFTLYFALEILYEKISFYSKRFLRNLVIIISALVSVQVVYGAFVAGLHAGRIYNTFPLMNGKIIPDGLFFLSPAWINLFDNLTAVQFIHRMLAGIIFILACMFFYSSVKNKIAGTQKNAMIFFMYALVLQIALGIFTLLTSVSIPLAILHQSGAFILYSSCVYLLFVFQEASES